MVSYLTNREAKKPRQAEEAMTAFEPLTFELGQDECGRLLFM
jgi:hypothetical protein